MKRITLLACLLLAGCAEHKATATKSGGLIVIMQHPTWERRPDLADFPAEYPNRGIWTCSKGYWLAYQGHQATISEMQNHNADTYCVHEELP